MYWKFLRAGAVSPFTAYAWPPAGQWVDAAAPAGQWVDAAAPAGPPVSGEPPAPLGCRQGFHACRLADLPYWMLDELWQVELAGPVVESAYKVAAPRARLVRPVPAWNADAAARLALACTARTARHAAAELRAAGLDGHADRLDTAALEVADASAGTAPAGTGATPLDTLRPLAEETIDVTERAGLRRASVLCGYVADAVSTVGVYPVASVAYIAARSAAYRGATLPVEAAPPAGRAAPVSAVVLAPGDAAAAERWWQAQWLRQRLGLGRAAG